MSRLYIKHESDVSDKGHRGHTSVEASLYYGSAGNSIKAVRTTLIYYKESDEYKLFIDTGKHLQSIDLKD